MSNKKEKREKKLPLGKLISNVLYVFGYAFRADKKNVALKVVVDTLSQVIIAIYSALIFKLIIDFLSAKRPFVELLFVVLCGFGARIIQALLREFSAHYCDSKLAIVSGNIQRDFIKKAAKMDLISYDNPQYFDDFVIAASQSEEMLGKCVSSVATFMGFSVSILTVGGIIFSINPFISIFPIAGFVVNIITRFKIINTEYEMDLERKAVQRKTDYSKRVFYQPEYAKEIKLSGVGAPLEKQLDESIIELQAVAKKHGMKIAIYSLINWITVFTFLSFFCLPAYLGYLALVVKSIALGDVASMNTAANKVRNYLDALNYTLAELQKVGLYADRFRAFIEYEPNIEATSSKAPFPEALSEINLENVSFKYEGSDNYALKNLNITIKPGEKIALVGHNGAGKTTFVKLLMRLYDVTEGEITYGGINIKDFGIGEYRSNIGAVFQDFQIYAATLGENVKMDFTDENEKADIEKCLEKADFARKLSSLKNGTETEMTREFSDDGTMLSGGESQKVAISRMFAKPFKIAILDEPSSALDPVAEANLNQSMIENAADASIIFISHRLSTTRICDKIFMFENGEIIEQGTHNELMAQDGKYAQMFEKQAKYYQEKEITA